MQKKKPGKEQDAKHVEQQDPGEDLFASKSTIDEIESDGSGNAFEETETVNEDNFDDLSEK